MGKVVCFKKKVLILALVAVFGFLVAMSFFYLAAMNTGLLGRRGGPQDAFRHIYASAVVHFETDGKGKFFLEVPAID